MNIITYDHVGIRVTDRSRSLAFYAGNLVDEWLSLGSAETDTIPVLEVG